MTSVGNKDTRRRSSLAQSRVIVASFVGTSLEWYDYFIYGTAAAIVFPSLFFPQSSPLAATLASFATFAVGFVVRPLGGAFFGHFGDRLGRKRVLVVTLLVMGVATMGVGLLPTYESVGAWGPVLLVVLRLAQGFALGGEWSGAVLLATENSAAHRRGFAGSWPQMGSPAGLLLATGAFALASTVSGDAFLEWGWRLPFLVSAALVVFGLWVRLGIGETLAFQKVKETRRDVRAPLIEVIRRHPRNFVLGIFARIAIDTTFYILSVYALNYAVTNLGVARNTMLVGLVLAAVLGLFTMPLFGILADRVGQRAVLVGALLFMGAFALPFFMLLESGHVVLMWLAVVVAYGVGTSAGWSPFAGFMTRLFSAPVRYSGTAMSFQLAGIFGGGIAPTVATLLYAGFGGTAAIAVYWAGVCVISLVCMFAFREYPGDDPVIDDAAAKAGR